MSDETRMETEQELWDVLTDPVVTTAKPEHSKKSKPKSGPRFASEAPIKDVPAAPVKRKPDAFFFACMAGVAAVSVAATLVFGGMAQDRTPGANKRPAASTVPTESTDNDRIAQLEQENELLREQVQLQNQQLLDLQAQFLDLTGNPPAPPTEPGATTPAKDPQTEANEIFNQIRDAYADFDRDTLDRLIPEMDKRLSYLSSDALNEYYMILEYVETPSNG